MGKEYLKNRAKNIWIRIHRSILWEGIILHKFSFLKIGKGVYFKFVI